MVDEPADKHLVKQVNHRSNCSNDTGMACMDERRVSRFTVVNNDTISYLPDCKALCSAKAESLPPFQLKTAFFRFSTIILC
jgi:hypothetical protein